MSGKLVMKIFIFNFILNNFNFNEETSKWPRLVVHNPQKNKKTFDTWTCNNNGKVNHVISTKKRNKYNYI